MKNTAHYLRSHVSAIVKFSSYPQKNWENCERESEIFIW